jgi:hypothetical protein
MAASNNNSSNEVNMFQAVIASAAKQSRCPSKDWIASSQVLLAMTSGLEKDMN